MTWTFVTKVMPLAAGSVLAAATFAATALATSGSAWAQCDNVGAAEQCVAAPCPEAQTVDSETGECREKNNQAAVAQSPASQTPNANQVAQAPEAPLKAAWERQFGPLPSPEDFALARVENPTVGVSPAVGLPGVGLNLDVVPDLAAGAAGAAGPAMAAIAASPPPALPAPPPLPYPCFGFATPIPFVGFSTGC